MGTVVQELIEDLKQECKSYCDNNSVYLKACVEREKQQIIDTAVEFGNQCAETMRERGEEYYNLINKK